MPKKRNSKHPEATAKRGIRREPLSCMRGKRADVLSQLKRRFTLAARSFALRRDVPHLRGSKNRPRKSEQPRCEDENAALDFTLQISDVDGERAAARALVERDAAADALGHGSEHDLEAVQLHVAVERAGQRLERYLQVMAVPPEALVDEGVLVPGHRGEAVRSASTMAHHRTSGPRQEMPGPFAYAVAGVIAERSRPSVWGGA